MKERWGLVKTRKNTTRSTRNRDYHDSLGGMDPRLTFRGGGGGVGNLEEEEEEEEESCPQNITLPPVRVLASAHGYLKPPPTQ